MTVGGAATGAVGSGVFAMTGTGNNTVTVGGDATGATDSGGVTTTGVTTAGVFAETSTGNNTVTVGGNATGMSGDGVFATTTSGNNQQSRSPGTPRATRHGQRRCHCRQRRCLRHHHDEG